MFNQNIDKFISKYNEGSFMTKAQRRALRRQLKNTIDFQQKAKEKKSLELEAKSVNQQNYIDNLIDQKTSIVVAQGPAGTGKTYLAVKAAIRALKYKQHSKIIMTTVCGQRSAAIQLSEAAVLLASGLYSAPSGASYPHAVRCAKICA